MKTLGIDYGRSKVGIALAVGNFSEPYKVIRYKDMELLNTEIKQIVAKENIDKVIVGISEMEMGKESKGFSVSLSKILKVPVETFDETLTSKDAQRLSVEAGISRKKRRSMEDAYAASVMLQNYLDFG
jgi:putative holliday junction resolvase